MEFGESLVLEWVGVYTLGGTIEIEDAGEVGEAISEEDLAQEDLAEE
jgi:hypothetical protein